LRYHAPAGMFVGSARAAMSSVTASIFAHSHAVKLGSSVLIRPDRYVGALSQAITSMRLEDSVPSA
jgi:hypothetical protein